jgi:hypothetical protein
MLKATMMTAALLGLAACGGPGVKLGGGKTGAAQALQAASAPTKAGVNKSASPIDVTGALDYQCPHGGSARLEAFKVNVNDTAAGGVVSQSFIVKYTKCGLAQSQAGIVIYDGRFEVAQRVEESALGGTVEQTFKGRLTLSGAFDDFLEADIKQRVADSALGAGNVSVRLEGSLKTS